VFPRGVAQVVGPDSRQSQWLESFRKESVDISRVDRGAPGGREYQSGLLPERSCLSPLLVEPLELS
jgi:hypothetical protein